ncbi:TetR family transcriptional regulator [Streptomyces sp. SID4944]|nr:TetR family transcriptional regulator [Streptomyces sp. SID4944]
MGNEPLAGEHYHHGNLHAALLDSALTVLTEKGVAGFSMREAARRAGVSQSAPNITSATHAGSSAPWRPAPISSSATSWKHST